MVQFSHVPRCRLVCVCVLVPQPVLGADAQLRPFGSHYFTLQLKVRDKSHRKLAENSLFPRLSVIHRGWCVCVCWYLNPFWNSVL